MRWWLFSMNLFNRLYRTVFPWARRVLWPLAPMLWPFSPSRWAPEPACIYVSGISPVIANVQLPIPVAPFSFGGLAAAGLAALIGIPVLRLKSDYLAIATLGFSEIIRAFIAAPHVLTPLPTAPTA